MKVVILGCGRMGANIASTMSRNNHDVTIIDQNSDSFRRLTDDYTGQTVLGNGIDEDTLRRADIEKADAFVAVTNGDNRNIMSVQMAKVSFKVPKVVARIYDPIRAHAYREFDLNTICTTCIGAGIMHDMLLDKPFGHVNDYWGFGLVDDTVEEAND